MKSMKSYILQYNRKTVFSPDSTCNYTVNTFFVTSILLGSVLSFSAYHLLIFFSLPCGLEKNLASWSLLNHCITKALRKPSEGSVSLCPWTGEKMDSDPKLLLSEFRAAPVRGHKKMTDKGICFIFCKSEGRNNQGMNKNPFWQLFWR